MNLSDAVDDVDSRQFDPAEATTKDSAICFPAALKSLDVSEADGEIVDSQAAPFLTLALARYITDLGFDRGIDLQAEVRQFERGLIERALELTKGNQKRASKLLGLHSSTVNTKIKKYGLKARRRKNAKR